MDTQQAIVEVTERPKVGDLINEFKRNGSQGDQFGRMLRAEDTRLARWDGQSEDGKKHAADQPDGDEVFPWEGASDVRNYLADSAVNETVDLQYMAFWSAILKIAGATPDDLTDSATAQEYLDWMIHFQLLKQLDVEVELSAQYMNSIGATALHVMWEREVGRRLQPVSMENLLAMGQQVDQEIQQARAQTPHPSPLPMAPQTPPSGEGMAPGAGGGMGQGGSAGQQIPAELLQLQEVLQALPQMLMDKSMEAEAVKAIQYLYGEYVHKQLPDDLADNDVLALSDKRARQCVRDLRNEGTCEFPMPFLAKNQPRIAALKPYRDFVLPVEVGSIETAPVVFVRDLVTEADLRRMVLGAGWDPDWVEEAVQTKGNFSTWQLNNPYSAYGTWSWRAVDNRSWLIEVVYAYYKQIDEDGVTQITVTIFSPHLTRNPKQEAPNERSVKDSEGKIIFDDFCAKFEILNNPKPEYPIILGGGNGLTGVGWRRAVFRRCWPRIRTWKRRCWIMWWIWRGFRRCRRCWCRRGSRAG